MTENRTALGICCHPDDIEFLCAGTLALLKQKGWQIHLATMTPGDCGSVQYNREEISHIRRGEAAASAKLLDAGYDCLECDDVFLMYDRPTLMKVIELIRKVRPILVLTNSPSDYMVDHEIASKLTQTACFGVGIPNIETPGVQPFDMVPYLYYADAIESVDKYGHPIASDILVDISATVATKEKMLCCHASQRDWLLKHHGMDEYVVSMKRQDEHRGRKVGAQYAEGFRQHLGHGYPSDNILKAELQDLVHLLPQK